jgi:hypothetical protein
MNKLKCWICYPSEDPNDEGCLLVFAPSRNKARHYACNAGGWFNMYLEMRARRLPNFDGYAIRDDAHSMCNNNRLPKGIKFFVE